jgi:hypothetical protein
MVVHVAVINVHEHHAHIAERARSTLVNMLERDTPASEKFRPQVKTNMESATEIVAFSVFILFFAPTWNSVGSN